MLAIIFGLSSDYEVFVVSRIKEDFIVGSRIWYHPRWFPRCAPVPDIEGERLEHLLAEGGIRARV